MEERNEYVLEGVGKGRRMRGEETEVKRVRGGCLLKHGTEGRGVSDEGNLRRGEEKMGKGRCLGEGKMRGKEGKRAMRDV